MRERILDAIAELFRFGDVKSSTTGPVTKAIRLEVEGIEGEASSKNNDLWGHAPLLYNPAGPSIDVASGSEGCQAMFYQLGDRKAVFATRDLRWQIEVADGEVILRAMGAGSPAYVHLKPDGSAKIVATSINLGGAATQFVALANLVLTELNDIRTKYDTFLTSYKAHTHAGVTAGAAVTATALGAAALSAMGAASAVAATKTKAE